MLARLAARPRLVALLIGLAAELLFAWQLGRPDRLAFDEVHYIPAARALLALSGPVNVEHPMLGKELIALGMLVFGDDPIGWRAAATLAGAATVVGMFALLMLLSGRMRTALFGAALAMLNQLVFVQARTGMLDIFLGALLIWGLVALTWAAHGTARQVTWRWVLGSALLGLAVGVKWTAVPYLGFVAVAFLVARRWRRGELWPGLHPSEALGLLGALSFVAYALTFLPAFFYAHDALTLAGFVPLQLHMYAMQTFKLAAHPYQSHWWSWPLMLRPIWYFYEPDMGAVRGVLLLGNPVVMWGGLAAVAACYWAGLRDRAWLPLAAALWWSAALLVWAVIPKSLGFYYYYYLPGLFLCVAIAAAFEHYDGGRRGWDEWFAGAALVAFVYFYPILSAAPLAGPTSYLRWMWLPSWI